MPLHGSTMPERTPLQLLCADGALDAFYNIITMMLLFLQCHAQGAWAT
jgi:hypothetical protein